MITNITTGDVLATGYVQYNAASLGNLAAGASATQQFAFSLPNGEPGRRPDPVHRHGRLQPERLDAGRRAQQHRDAHRDLHAGPYPDLAPRRDRARARPCRASRSPSAGRWPIAASAAASGPWTEQVLLATDAAGDNPTLLAAQILHRLARGGPVGLAVDRRDGPRAAPGQLLVRGRREPVRPGLRDQHRQRHGRRGPADGIAGGLTLTLACTHSSDAAGANATTATVTRNTDTTEALTVTIGNSDPNDVSAPQTVTIPAGATSATFAVGTINNHVVEGTQTATLTAAAAGLASGSDTLTVTDTNVPTLTVALNGHTVNETDPNPATYGTVTRNTPTTAALTVSLASSNMKKLNVPATVTIPAGAASVTFPVTVVNDGQIDGNQTTMITASAAGFQPGSDSADVVDDNIPSLTLSLTAATVSEAAGANATTGTVSIAKPAISPITIALTSSDTTAATVPTTVVINAGRTSASFPIAAVDDGQDTGDKTAIITASVETVPASSSSRGRPTRVCC